MSDVMVWEPKNGAAGIEARLRLLSPYPPDADRLVQEVHGRERRMDVRSGDVVDAMAAFVVASAGPVHLRTLPPGPSLDDACLPMGMVYLDADGTVAGDDRLPQGES